MTIDSVSKTEIISEIKKISVSERILIVEDIWDSIFDSNEQLSITPEQKTELDKRYLDYKRNPDNKSSWEEVKERYFTETKSR
jgi:putative addiction module component (TIGR02574 family)